MYTANTMASAIEALGMTLPFNSSNPALSEAKQDESVRAGETIRILLEKNIRPSDIVTKKSLENAVRLVTVLGGSTNAVLHFLAIASTAGVKFTLDDFQRISETTPLLADLKPNKYLIRLQVPVEFRCYEIPFRKRHVTWRMYNCNRKNISRKFIKS